MTGQEEELFRLINEGKDAEARALLEAEKVDLDCVDKEGMTPLSAASYKGLDDLVKYLIDRGADVNTKAHKHGYTPLMFAALAGKPDMCRVLMDAGAYAQKTNTINKTAGEMAAFVGQHEAVTVINNHVCIDEVEKYLHPKGEDSEEVFPRDFVKFVHSLASSHKVHPVSLVFLLRDNPQHLARSKKLMWTIDRVFEQQLRCKEPNEVMSMKLWLVLYTLREAFKFIDEHTPKTKLPPFCPMSTSPADLCAAYARHLLKTGPEDLVRPNLDRHLRAAIVAFPYHQSLLFETMVKAMAKTAFGNRPSAYDYIIQALFGQRIFASQRFCDTCGGPSARKRCIHCKLPYCSQECQRFDWPIHKKVCAAIAARATVEAQSESSTEVSPRDTVEVEATVAAGETTELPGIMVAKDGEGCTVGATVSHDVPSVSVEDVTVDMGKATVAEK